MTEFDRGQVSVAEQLQEQGVVISPEAEGFLLAAAAGETDGISGWRSPDVERRQGSPIEGQGLFPVRDIAANTLIAVKEGRVVDSQTVKANLRTIRGSHQQIDRDHFLAGLTPEEVDKNLLGYNHSCDPNSRIVLIEGTPLAFLVTKREIQPGEEEVTVDYSLTQCSDTARVEVCQCGSANCRGFIAPLWDWEQEEFQKEHAGELAWFIEDLIRERSESDERVRQIHGNFAPLKMAALIRIADDEIQRLVAARESAFALLADYPFQSLLRRRFDTMYDRSETGRELRELEARRLQAAVYFCTFGLPEGPYAPEDLDLGMDRLEAFKAVMTGDDEELRRRVNQQLAKVIEIARRLDYAYNP